VSLFSILNQGARSLRVASAGIATASNNVANANTQGYARETLGVTTAGSQRRGGMLLGQGVTATQVSSAYDTFSQRAVFSQLGSSSYSSSRASTYNAIESNLVEGAEGGLAGAVSQFFDDWAALESDPSSVASRQQLLARGENLVRRFNSAATQLDSEQTNADARVQQRVARVNVLAGEVATLNAQIVRLESSGGRANDLRANRTQILEELAELGPVRSSDQADGSARVLFANHVLVEDDDQRLLSVVADPITGFGQVHIAQGSTSFDISSAVTGGSLGADINIRDTVTVGLLSSLDDLAFTLSTQVNTVHSVGFGLDGLTGRNFFGPLAAAGGAAQAIALDAAVVGTPDAIAAATSAAGVPGDNTGAAAISALAGQNLMAGATQTFGRFYGGFIAGLGQDAASAYQNELRSDLELSGAYDLRDSISGVNLEEEALDIIRFKDAYSASARVLTVANELFNDLLRIV
jgi:flagellar hook-associated protein 1 FlgK